MSGTRFAVLLRRHQPERSIRSIEASAGLPESSLCAWLDEAVEPRPPELVPVETMSRIAAATGAPLAAVSRALTGTWFDFNGWQWNHFRAGDEVVVFGEQDPETGACQVRRGRVTAVDPLDTIDVRFDDGSFYQRQPEAEGRISHLGGGCRCSTPL
ncbi:MAG: hypothetical protein JWQ81_1612 [Amycolatopsis sp.]|jgi:hypothetical protein|uniref:hypothetical protein n=1 Tax=Amycolatopsis sp. TaxID=37632 RepID=UPI002633B62A|nr:hypothetical protein [Amycolatopsis sp.]MCU1680873.1 hypothetical protein [Amycolatopsis sp.]